MNLTLLGRGREMGVSGTSFGGLTGLGIEDLVVPGYADLRFRPEYVAKMVRAAIE